MSFYNNDVTLRTTSVTAAREIKASAHYAYITGGATLDGSKFAVGELILEGQALVKDDVTGKYEKYADGNPTPAVIIGAVNVTPAGLNGINAGTSVKFTVNGMDYVIANAALAALMAAGGTAAIIAAVKAAANIHGGILDDVASVALSANKLRVATEDMGSGQTITFTGTWGIAGDQATVEGAFGMVTGLTDVGTGAFPAGKSNPVVLDESIKFVPTDAGANPDVTFGQGMVHGAVYSGMCIGATAAFKAAFAGSVRFI